MDVDGGLNADGSIAAYDFETSMPSTSPSFASWRITRSKALLSRVISTSAVTR